MIRLVAVIFGLILGWLGFLSTAEAAIAVPTQSYVQAYEYDGHRMPVQVVDANSERGPPAACDYATNHDAVGHRSRGDSVRPSGTTPRAAFAYDQQAPLAQAVSAATPTAGPGRAASGDARARLGASVAANTAIGFAEGLGKTALTPGRLQHGTKNLTKAGVLPAWSGKSSPGIIERSFVPILERPTATFDHALGGTRVRGFLGDIDGNQVALFVYKEGPYQGQLASSLSHPRTSSRCGACRDRATSSRHADDLRWGRRGAGAHRLWLDHT